MGLFSWSNIWIYLLATSPEARQPRWLPAT